MSAFKRIFIIFSFGLFFGLGVSPWADTRPQQAFLSPVKNINAQSIPTIKPELSKDEHFSLKQFFNQFELEQQQKILGEKTKLGSEKQGSATIAVFGDSMIDTMGTNLPYLKSVLQEYYPNYSFHLYNYGIGSQPATKGISRVNSEYNYKDRNYPPITSLNADVIILGSFAYNPTDNIDQYKIDLSQLITSLQSHTNNFFFLATIAPLKSEFGKGPGGVNWETNTAYQHATTIQTFMDSAIAIANSHSIPIIDAYHPTMLDGGEGTKPFVSTHDGIHPSIQGHQYIAQKIGLQIAEMKILE